MEPVFQSNPFCLQKKTIIINRNASLDWRKAEKKYQRGDQRKILKIFSNIKGFQVINKNDVPIL
jgi:hypothetical protein